MALFYFFLTLFLFVSLLLSCTILLQESKSTGLGASFGGDSGDSLFGTSTADVLKKFTAIVAILFVFGCVTLSIWTSFLGRASEKSLPEKVLVPQKSGE
ncbi:MAG: preprotein translocase subunit SecG [Chlamydiota bacterium]